MHNHISEALVARVVKRSIAELTAPQRTPKKNVSRVQQIVFVETARYYGVTVKHLRTSRTRGLTTECRIMTILQLAKNCGLNPRAISTMFNVTPNLVSKRIRAFERAVAGDRSEKIYGQDDFIRKFNEIAALIRKAKKL